MKKFTKKLVASMLSTAMLMGMSLTAFAANSQTQGISVNGYSGPGRQITNTWSVAENGLLNDSETFDFALEYTGSDAIGTNASSTPTFNGSEMTQNNATKTAQKSEGAGFENTEADAESLKITKTVSGSAANKNDEFTFTVVVNGIDGTYSTNKADVTVTNGEKTTFTLKHGETFEIKNLPAGADYTVNEIDSKGYDTTNVSVNGENAVESKSANGTINLDKTNTVAYTNIDTVTPPTGVILHFAPVLLAFAAAFGGCLVFFRRKRI